MSSTQHWFFFFFHSLKLDIMKHSCPSATLAHAPHPPPAPPRRWSRSARAWSTCVNVVCASPWESAARHPAIGATGAAGVLICQPNRNGPLLFPEQLYPSRSSRPPPLFSSHLSSTVFDGCHRVSGYSVNVTVLQWGGVRGAISDCSLPSRD